MAAPVRMDNQMTSLWQISNHLIQHGVDQIGIRAGSDRLAHNHFIKTIDNGGEIQLAVRKGKNCDIRPQLLIRLI